MLRRTWLPTPSLDP